MGYIYLSPNRYPQMYPKDLPGRQGMAQLTEMKLKAIKPGAKMARYYDSGGLYLQVSPTGGKYWRFKYRVEKKEKLVALGTWPQVSLKEAREKRD